MIAPIVLTTTKAKETLRCRHQDGGLPLRPCDNIRVVIDAYDVVKIIEVQKEDPATRDTCEVYHSMEKVTPPKKDDDSPLFEEVSVVRVLHTLDEIIEKIETAKKEAKRERPEWE